MRAAGLLLLCGCRIGFDPVGDSTGNPRDPGLIAWYRMEEAADGAVGDETGHHHGTCDLPACPGLIVDGQFGHAYVFDGVDDIVRIPSAAELETRESFTVAAWFRLDAAGGGCFINKGFGADTDNSWQACLDSTRISFFSLGAPDMQVPSALEVGRWYHLALRWGGGLKAVYLDGVRLDEIPGGGIAFDEQDVTIGADLDDGKPVARFAGGIDDVRIYDRALSEAELANLQTQ